MSFAELVAEVSRDSGLSQRTVARALRAFISATSRNVSNGRKVVLPKFGVFLPKDLEERPLFNGKRMTKKRRTIRFRQSRKVR